MTIQEQLKQLQTDMKMKQHLIFLYPTTQIFKKQVEEIEHQIKLLQLEADKEASSDSHTYSKWL